MPLRRLFSQERATRQEAGGELLGLLGDSAAEGATGAACCPLPLHVHASWPLGHGCFLSCAPLKQLPQPPLPVWLLRARWCKQSMQGPRQLRTRWCKQSMQGPRQPYAPCSALQAQTRTPSGASCSPTPRQTRCLQPPRSCSPTSGLLTWQTCWASCTTPGKLGGPLSQRGAAAPFVTGSARGICIDCYCTPPCVRAARQVVVCSRYIPCTGSLPCPTSILWLRCGRHSRQLRAACRLAQELRRSAAEQLAQLAGSPGLLVEMTSPAQLEALWGLTVAPAG